MPRINPRVWLGISLATFLVVVLLSVWLYPEWRESLQGWFTVLGLAAVGVATVIPAARGLFERPQAAITTKVGGDMNELRAEPNAIVKQAVTGRENNATFIETQNVIQSAPAPREARFSISAPPASFVGRAEEIKQIVDALKAGGANITGLSGMGGVGKTALALCAANEVAGQYHDGQILVEMLGTSKAPLKPVDAMGQVIRAMTDMNAKPPENPDDVLQEYRSVLHGQRVLLLLDNAHDGAQVRPLTGVSGCAVLVTARRHFDVGGLTLLRLGVLKEEEAKKLLLTRCPGIGTHAAEIGKLCGYLPLALEIAAGLLAVRDDVAVPDYVRSLQQRRLATLKQKDDADFDVEIAFDESYAQLDTETQTRWRMLGVFPASFTAEAALAVWDEQDADKGKDLLSELRRYSLVEWNAGRYELHDLLKEYARGKQSAVEKQQAAKRHAAFYVQVTAEAKALYKQGGGKVLEGLALFDAELVNIRAGQAWAAANREGDRDAARLCSKYPNAGAYVISLRLGAHEQIRWLVEAVAAARLLKDRASEANHLGNLGNGYSDLGEKDKAIEYYEQALVIAREIGDRRMEGNTLGNLGNGYRELGEPRKAIEYYEQALVIAREIGDRHGEANHLGNLGNGYSDLGEPRKAIEYYEQALAIAREMGDRRGEGAHLGNLGNGYRDLGEKDKARECWERALRIFEEIESPYAEWVRGWLKGLDGAE